LNNQRSGSLLSSIYVPVSLPTGEAMQRVRKKHWRIAAAFMLLSSANLRGTEVADGSYPSRHRHRGGDVRVEALAEGGGAGGKEIATRQVRIH